jgi:hypothetical protein
MSSLYESDDATDATDTERDEEAELANDSSAEGN